MTRERAAIAAILVVLGLALFLEFQPRIVVIGSSSMRPTLEPKDAVLTVRVKPEDIEVGDVIAYVKVVPFASVQTVTHRVVDVITDGVIYCFKAKGDANPSPDRWDIVPQEIVGKAVIVIPRLGQVFYYISGNLPTVALVTLGLGFILIYKEKSVEE